MHWFVAGIPEAAGGLKSVFAAMEALKPAEVIDAQRRQGVKGKDRYRRKNAAYVRQGEWFFLPMPNLHVKREEVLYNEPLSRGNGSKPHWAEFLCRRGGQEVFVCSEYPQGLASARTGTCCATSRGPSPGPGAACSVTRRPTSRAASARRSQDDRPAHLAQGPHEHGEPEPGDASRGVPGLMKVGNKQGQHASHVGPTFPLTSGMARRAGPS